MLRKLIESSKLSYQQSREDDLDFHLPDSDLKGVINCKQPKVANIHAQLGNKKESKPIVPTNEIVKSVNPPSPIAKDGAFVIVLTRGNHGSQALFYRTPSSPKSVAVKHKTVYEIWFCESGFGVLVTYNPGAKYPYQRYFLSPNSFVVIPTVCAFYWERTSEEPLKIMGITLGPWPLGKKGEEEANSMQDNKVVLKMKSIVNRDKRVQSKYTKPLFFNKANIALDGALYNLLINRIQSPKAEMLLYRLVPNQITKPITYNDSKIKIEQLVYVLDGCGIVAIQRKDKIAPMTIILEKGVNFFIPSGATFHYQNSHKSKNLDLQICITPSYLQAIQYAKVMGKTLFAPKPAVIPAKTPKKSLLVTYFSRIEHTSNKMELTLT